MTTLAMRWFLGMVMLMAATVTCAAEVVGVVVGIVDGDTIDIVDQDKVQHRVRLAGIDAPEKRQSFGQQSKKSLSDLVYMKSVVVEFNKRDRYGRLIGKIVIAGVDVNLTQIEKGMAWIYRQYLSELQASDRLQYVNAEAVAKNSRRGLWVDESPVPPWSWRRAK